MKIKSYDSIGEQVCSEKLANGLNVFVIPKRGFSKYYAFFATRYGGADRRFRHSGRWIDSPEGVAHFLEHKMFDTKDGNALSDLSANGASPNAFTSTDMTAYYFESVEKFQENLRLLLSFVSVPFFTAESVKKEQGIIGQEIKMGEDDPDNVVYYGLMKALYQYHPLRDSVAGTVESISRITPEVLYSCHKVFYNPSNMVLVVVGDVEPETVFSIARSTLPDEPGEIPARDYGQEESTEANSDRFEKRMEVSRPLFIIGYKLSPAKRGKDCLKTELIGELALRLISGGTSHLYSRLYEEGLINRTFNCGVETSADRINALFSGESSQPDAVFEAIKCEIRRVCAEGFDPAYYERIKRAHTGKLIRSLNSFEGIAYSYADGFFRGYDSFDAVDTLCGITSDDVVSFIRTELTDARSAIAVVSPIEKS